MHSHLAASQTFTAPDQPPVHTKFCVGALRTDATGRASAAWDWARASDRSFAKVLAAAASSAPTAAASAIAIEYATRRSCKKGALVFALFVGFLDHGPVVGGVVGGARHALADPQAL